MENNHLLNFTFDHYAIAVSDLEKSLAFYNGILKLPIIERPDFNFKGAWLDLQQGQAIHLILSDDVIVFSSSRKLHFAFAHHDLDELNNYFLANEITTMPIKIRPDGVRQLYIVDPDGYWIEFCETRVLGLSRFPY